MKIILQEKVSNLGGIGDTVDVKPGFARNFLIPNGKAVRATEENIALVAAKRAELEKAAADKLTRAHERAEVLATTNVTIEANAGEEGKLFGSISNRDIADAITAEGHAVDKKEVQLPEGPIRTTGEFDITLLLHSEVSATVKVTVVPEDAQTA